MLRRVTPPRAGNMRLSAAGIFTAARQRDGDARRGGATNVRLGAAGAISPVADNASGYVQPASVTNSHSGIEGEMK